MRGREVSRTITFTDAQLKTLELTACAAVRRARASAEQISADYGAHEYTVNAWRTYGCALDLLRQINPALAEKLEPSRVAAP